MRIQEIIWYSIDEKYPEEGSSVFINNLNFSGKFEEDWFYIYYDDGYDFMRIKAETVNEWAYSNA